MTIPPQPPLPPGRSWFSRNWKWFLPVGCLLPILFCGGFITTIFIVVFGAIKSSEPYQHALVQARANPAVIAALGTPIEPGTFPSGTINIINSSGNADLTIPIAGPNGSATIYVIATKSAGQWTYTTLEVQPANSTNRIPLQPTPAPKAP
jgi:hypothetical protein